MPDGAPTCPTCSTAVVAVPRELDPFASIPEHLRPEAACPSVALAAILGPEMVCRLVKEAEQIRQEEATTHTDIRLHWHRGQPVRADWAIVRGVALGGVTWKTP